jgi:hypothetical protein
LVGGVSSLVGYKLKNSEVSALPDLNQQVDVVNYEQKDVLVPLLAM